MSLKEINLINSKYFPAIDLSFKESEIIYRRNPNRTKNIQIFCKELSGLFYEYKFDTNENVLITSNSFIQEIKATRENNLKGFLEKKLFAKSNIINSEQFIDVNKYIETRNANIPKPFGNEIFFMNMEINIESRKKMEINLKNFKYLFNYLIFEKMRNFFLLDDTVQIITPTSMNIFLLN